MCNTYYYYNYYFYCVRLSVYNARCILALKYYVLRRLGSGNYSDFTAKEEKFEVIRGGWVYDRYDVKYYSKASFALRDQPYWRPDDVSVSYACVVTGTFLILRPYEMFK